MLPFAILIVLVAFGVGALIDSWRAPYGYEWRVIIGGSMLLQQAMSLAGI